MVKMAKMARSSPSPPIQPTYPTTHYYAPTPITLPSITLSWASLRSKRDLFGGLEKTAKLLGLSWGAYFCIDTIYRSIG